MKVALSGAGRTDKTRPAHNVGSSVSLLALALFSVDQPAAARAAANAAAYQSVPFNISPQSLDSALLAFSRQAGIQLVVNSGDITHFRSLGVVGRHSPDQAVRLLLGNLPLSSQWIGRDLLVVKPLVTAKKRIGALNVDDAPSTPQEPAVLSDAGAGLQEIIVTANRRSENIQDVPIAISVVGAERLERAGIVGTVDLQQLVPGLHVNYSGGFFLPYLRGVGSNVNVAGNESSVAMYVDGVYQPYSDANNMAFNNIARIEVDKGPQGTLFGRNATGGVINIMTKEPSQNFEGKLQARYGNFDTFTTSDYITGAIFEDLAADFAVYYSDQGRGFGRNHFTDEDTAKTDNLALRTKWLWTPSANDKITIAIDYSRQKSTANGFRSVRGYTQGRGGTTNGPLLRFPTPGSTAANFGLTVCSPALQSIGLYDACTAAGPDNPANPFGTPSQPVLFNYGPWDFNGLQPRQKNEQFGGYIRYEHDFPFATLQNTIAYRHNDSHIFFPFVESPNPIQTVDLDQPGRALSEELILTSPGESKLKWVAGVYYFRNRAKNALQLFEPPLIGADFPTTTIDIDGNSLTRSIAGFAQVTMPVPLGDTNITAGIRYTKERRTATIFQVFTRVDGPPPVVTGPFPQSQCGSGCDITQDPLKFSKLTYRLAVDHNFTPDIMGYVSFNRGFKSGFLNTQFIGAPTVKPEVLDAYEVGLKTDLLDRKVRANMSAFYYDYTNLQVTIFGLTGSILTNGPRAEIYGVDFDVSAQVTENLTIGAAMEWLHPRFKSFPAAPFYIDVAPAQGGGSILVPGDASGNNLPYAPDFVSTLTVDYSLPTARGTFDFNVTWTYNNGFYGTIDNSNKQSSYSVLNGQMSWTLPDEPIRLGIWGRNLTNKAYAAMLDRTDNSASGAKAITMAPPRTYGVSIDYSF